MYRFWLILLLSTNVFALSRSEIRSKIRDMVLDAGTSVSKQHWSSSTFNAYIDLAIHEIVSISWCMKNDYTLSIGTSYARSIYALKDTIADIERVTIHQADTVANVSYKEEAVALVETSLIALDDGSWETKFSTYSYGNHAKPTRYYTYQSTGTYLNIGFDPPAEKDYTITIYYSEIATALTSDTDIPFRGIKQLIPYHFLICLRVASIFTAFDEKSTLSLFYYRQYLALLADATKSLNWKSNYQQSMQGSWQ